MNEQPKLPNPLVAFLSTRTGISTAILTTAFTVAAPIVSHIWTHKSAYDEGQRDLEAAIRAGQAELDGKIVAVIDEDARQAAEDAAYIRGQVEGFRDAQAQFSLTLETINANHAQTIAAVGRRDFTPQERDWRSGGVPASTGMRLDRLAASRGTRGRDSRLPPIDDQSILVGGFPGDADASNGDEW